MFIKKNIRLSIGVSLFKVMCLSKCGIEVMYLSRNGVEVIHLSKLDRTMTGTR